MKSQWIVNSPPEEKVSTLTRFFGISAHLARVLVSRGIETTLDAYRYLYPRLSSLHSPFLMKNMHAAVSRIRLAVQGDEQIGIFSDSDLDGLTSLTLVLKLLEKIGLKREPYMRYPVGDDDYGLSRTLIDDCLREGVSLLITLDAGVRDVDEIAYAREKGIDVIVCDHHEEGKVLPDAIIINPKQSGCGYPFKELAGVGVAFKLCQGILLSYLNRHNKRVLLFTGENGALFVSTILDRAVTGVERLEDTAGLSRITVSPEDMILICDAGDAENEIRRYFSGYRVYDLYILVQSRAGTGDKKGISSIEALCREFDINRNAFENKIDVLNEIFLEYEYSASPKLEEFFGSVIDLVALGTIADIMPLRGENRTLIHYGLKSLGATSHPGLRLLLKSGGYSPTSKSIAWNIAPLLNTPGRLGKTELTAGFFLGTNEKQLTSVLAQLNSLNEERKRMLSGLFETLYSRVTGGEFIAGDNLVFVYDKAIPEGLCGLVANRLADALNKPVIAVSLMSGKDVVKGSGRSKGGFNFFSCVEPFTPLFEKIGGHAQAFGFSFHIGNLEVIRNSISEYLDSRAAAFPEQTFQIDIELPVESISLDLVNEISQLEPFGYKNEELLFLAPDITVSEFFRMGGDRNHGKYLFKGNHRVEAVGWNMADIMEKKLEAGRADIVFHLERNEFNGQATAQMRIIDID